MSRLNRILLPLILVACCNAGAWAQTARPSSDVLRELLAAPAPTPRTAETSSEETTSKRPPKFFDTQNVPPHDAPIEDLQEYWNHWVGRSDKPVPSEIVKQRLLDSTIDDFAQLANLL